MLLTKRSYERLQQELNSPSNSGCGSLSRACSRTLYVKHLHLPVSRLTFNISRLLKIEAVYHSSAARFGYQSMSKTTSFLGSLCAFISFAFLFPSTLVAQQALTKPMVPRY